MKVFLSWSGHKSHQVALAFREWLPSVIQSITPYVSSEDIDKGARWSTDIAKELENSSFGILCVTKDNIEAPWLLFEAGALSKMMDKSSVCPFLFDIKMSEINGPILQFQTTIYEKEEVEKLILSLNKSCGEAGLKEDLLKKSFEVWWPTLKANLDQITELQDEKASSKKQSKEEIENMLEEILALSRTNQKLLRSPESLLPKDYLNMVLRNGIGQDVVQSRQNPMTDRLLYELDRTRAFLDHYQEVLGTYEKEKKRVDKDLINVFDELYHRFMRCFMMTRDHLEI